MEPVCRIEMLGGLRVVRGQRTITRFSTRKAAALLAYLAYHRARPHPREVLVELLWPWSVPEAGRLSLRVALASLRRQLEPPGVSGGTVLQADRAAVQLSPTAVTTDVSDFEAALHAALAATSELRRTHSLAEAAGLYGGPLLPGHYEDWVLLEQARLAELYFGAVAELIPAYEASGESGAALDLAHRAVAADPSREASHYDLMRLLDAAGQPEVALRHYAELERILREQLGETPSAQTRQLVARLAQAADNPRRAEAPPHRRPPAPRPGGDRLPPGILTVLMAETEDASEVRGPGDSKPPGVGAAYRRLVREEAARWGGRELRAAAGSQACAFSRAVDALSCAVAVQRRLADTAHSDHSGHRRVRMGLHTGEPEGKAGSYAPVLAAARELLLAAHGGQILCSETAAVLLRPALHGEVALVGLGLYRLPGTTAPQNLYAVDYPDRKPRTFPAPNAPSAYPSNLPSQFTRFFGREEELAHLHALVRERQKRVITLVGPGGSGKTRLGIEAAHALRDEMGGAAWFVPLQDVGDARLVARAAADAMRLAPLPHVDPVEHVVDALGAQPALFVFDGFDLVAQGGAPLLQRLVEASPHLCCLVTSRQQLGLPGEVEFPVEPLPTPGGPAAPEELMRCPSVGLFVDRSQAVRPDFQLTAGNAPLVAELCDRLEGIPLALELAAARAQVLTPAQMVSRLTERFTWLETHRRGVADRHRTLRAALDWSYQLLPPELQSFFPCLSVFRGGWTAEAAASVCEEPEALRLLERLVACSLVVAHDDPADGGEVRFGLLETLREHGAEKLSAETQRELSRRHADHYLSLIERAEAELAGPESGYWLTRIRAEHENLHAALQATQGMPGGAMRALRLATAAAAFWRVQGYIAEGRALLEETIARARRAPATLRARALTRAGQLATLQGDLAAASERLGQGLAIWRNLGDPAGLADCLNALGVMELWCCHVAASRQLHEEAASLCRAAGLQRLLAASLDGFVHATTIGGDCHAGRAAGEEHLALARELRDPVELGRALHIVGTTMAQQGDWPSGKALLLESLAARRQLGDAWGLSETLYDLGTASEDAGDPEGARAYHEECLRLDQEMKFPQGLAFATSGLARADYRMGRYESARALWEQALTIFRSLRFSYGCAMCLGGLSRLAQHDGHLARARALLCECIEFLLPAEVEGYVPIYLRHFAALCLAEERAQDAAALLGAADGLCEAGAFAVSAADRPEYLAIVAGAREVLGDESFQAHVAAAKALDWKAVARAAMV